MKRLAPTGCVLALAAFFAAPALAQIYKCPGAGGATMIQQLPCAGGNKMDVKPAIGYDEPHKAETAPAPHEPVEAKDATPTVKPMTDAERIEANTQASIRERQRRDLEKRTVPRARATIYQHRDQCKRTLDALASDQYAYKQNLYGKTHAAQRASEMAAVSTECDTQDRALVTNFNTLLEQCRTLDGCAAIKP
jgi:hypothetical protein